MSKIDVNKHLYRNDEWICQSYLNDENEEVVPQVEN